MFLKDNISAWGGSTYSVRNDSNVRRIDLGADRLVFHSSNHGQLNDIQLRLNIKPRIIALNAFQDCLYIFGRLNGMESRQNVRIE